MKKKICSLLLAFMMLLSSMLMLVGCGNKLSPTEVYEQAEKSVCEITTYRKNGSELALGSGFVYSANGKIVTNFHVLEEAYSAKVTLNDIDYPVQQVLAYDRDKDLAVIKINATGLKPLKLSNGKEQVGEPAFAMGSSRGLTSTFTQGIITHADRVIENVHYVQHDAAISSGNSGGPLLNQYGQVMGVNTMTIKESQNLNFAVAVSEIATLNYDEPLTMSEFYEAEFDPWAVTCAYVILLGEYYYDTNSYDLDFGYSTYGGYRYKTGASYDITDKTLTLNLFITIDSLSHMVFVDIDQFDGSYKWRYINLYEQYMTGNIYGSTFNNNTVLSYTSYSGINTVSQREAVQELASIFIRIMIKDIKYDYSDLGYTAQDFGFVNFD